jgi:hypothetical protein
MRPSHAHQANPDQHMPEHRFSPSGYDGTSTDLGHFPDASFRTPDHAAVRRMRQASDGRDQPVGLPAAVI